MNCDLRGATFYLSRCYCRPLMEEDWECCYELDYYNLAEAFMIVFDLRPTELEDWEEKLRPEDCHLRARPRVLPPRKDEVELPPATVLAPCCI